MLNKALRPRADVLPPLAAQKKNIEGENLEWPEREIVRSCVASAHGA
jgi:hypothetical protein